MNLIDREDSAINSFFFPPPCFFFLFFLPTPFLFRRTRFARDRVILAYPRRRPRRRPADTREGEEEEGRGDASTELSTLEDARRLYRRVGSSWQGGCVWSSSRFVGSIVNCICFLYARFHPSPHPPPPHPVPHALPRRARGTESPLFCRFNVAYCRISPRMPSFPVPFPPPPPSLFTQSSHLSIRDITITPTSYQLLSSPIPSISIVSKELTSPLRFAFFFFFFFYSIEKRKLAELSVSFRFPSSIFVRISVVYEIG